MAQIMGEKKKHKRQVQIDEGLFERIGSGDMEAFGRLYDLTEKVLYAYLLGLSGNHHDALDLMQDTYLKAKAAAHLYKPQGKPLGWLFTIGRNLFLDQQRLRKRTVDMDDAALENRASLSFVAQSEDRIVLQTALEVLSEEDKAIVMMHAAGGMKHREIAGEMSMPLSTVLSRYSRAMKKLRNALEGGDAVYEKQGN